MATGPGSPAELSEWTRFAGEVADAAGAILRRYFRRPTAVETKADGTPVSAADRDAERAMRAAIEARWPDHGIRGEEFDDRNTDAQTVWMLDPIDGTRSFLTGKPLFATLVAVLHEGAPVVGLIDQPILRERWLGGAGRATTWNGTAARVRPCRALAEAALYSTGTEWFGPDDLEAFERLRREVPMTLFSADAYAFGLVASGHVDLVVEAGLEPHDFCALVPVVQGAGGLITDWEGRPLDPTRRSHVLAAGDPAAHAAARAVLAPR